MTANSGKSGKNLKGTTSFARKTAVGHLESLVGSNQLNVLEESGGKVLLTNHPVEAIEKP